MAAHFLSVIMPVYNSERFVSKAIESILSQTYANFEFIIINDGSTDKSNDIIYSYNDNRIKIINQKNMGLVSALNYGVKIAKGEWIARMDSDDIACENRFAEQIKYIDKNVAVIGTQAYLIDENDNAHGLTNLEVMNDKIISNILHHIPSMIHPTVLINRSKLLEIEGYDEKIEHAEDNDLWLRISTIGKIINIDKPLLLLRKHGNNISKTKLETAIINSYISLAYHYRSHSKTKISNNEYNVLAEHYTKILAPLIKRTVSIENIKETLRSFSTKTKFVFIISHPRALMNFVILKFERMRILSMLKKSVLFFSLYIVPSML